MCAQNAANELKRLFGEKPLYVEYTDPGYLLFKKVNDQINVYRERYQEEPQVIWLQNHGIFVAADTIDEIRTIYTDIMERLEMAITKPVPQGEKEICLTVDAILPAIRMMLSGGGLKTLKVRHNELIRYYDESEAHQQEIERPYTPDA